MFIIFFSVYQVVSVNGRQSPAESSHKKVLKLREDKKTEWKKLNLETKRNKKQQILSEMESTFQGMQMPEGGVQTVSVQFQVNSFQRLMENFKFLVHIVNIQKNLNVTHILQSFST